MELCLLFHIVAIITHFNLIEVPSGGENCTSGPIEAKIGGLM